MVRVSGDWLENGDTQAVCAMLTDAGYQALFVGGCVRNALLNEQVNDIDLSTDAPPDEVLRLAKQAGFHAIPTGIDHGTITVVANHIPHEITTFRKDVETDGRRAVVAFSTRVEDDAHRRDFTMNALYARPDGELCDPLGGVDDLNNRRVRFIDDADMRIREDYLRILRYFRFHAWYGDPQQGMDPEALAAIAANSSGIETLSKERLGAEMLKLLAAPDPAPAVAAMRQTGALGQVIEGADDRALAPLVHFDADLPMDPVRRLAAIGGEDVSASLRLSNKQAGRLSAYRKALEDMRPPLEIGYVHGEELGLGILALRYAVLETPAGQGDRADVLNGAKATFPVRPADLMPELSGPSLGAELKRLEAEWISSGFTLDKADLLSRKQ